MTDLPATAWFCVKSRPRQEAVAERNLRSLGEVEVVLPRLRRTRRGHDKNKVVVEPLFPGYLFLRFDPAALRDQVQDAAGAADRGRQLGRVEAQEEVAGE